MSEHKSESGKAVRWSALVRPRLTYAVVYMDNGPKGACGQGCVTTSEHTRVYLFDAEDDMREWLKANYDKMPKRKNSRVTCCYPRGDVMNYAYNNGLEWPNDEAQQQVPEETSTRKETEQ